MKTLDLIFRSPENGLKHLKLADVKSDLDADIVKAAMQQIIDSKIFVDKNDGQMYPRVASAVYIAEEDQVLFDEK